MTSKSCVSDTAGNKASPATPKATPKVALSKLNKTPSKLNGDSPSPLQNPRASAERSPRTITPRSSNIGRLSPRVAIPPDKAQSRILKPSELQAHLTSAQDELKKTKEKLLLVEKEKAEALKELEEARRLANDANEKLQESLVAQKQTEENSEVEKFWAAELEEEWQKEPEEVEDLRTTDLTFLLSTSEEHQRIKKELAMVTDIKNQALIHADEATKIAEINAEKVEILSAELIRFKSLLESKTEASENSDVVVLKSELGSLKQELELARGFEKNLAQKEESCELLKLELISIKEEVDRNKGLDIILVQKEKSCEQLKLELESISQELEKAKVLENILCQKEKSFISETEHLKQELERAKSLEGKVSLGDESYDQLKAESLFLKSEIEKAMGLEKLLFEKDASLQQLTWNLDSLKQELAKAKDLEKKLSKREADYEKLKSEALSLNHELAKALGYKENLIQIDGSLQKLKFELEVLKTELEKASFEQLSIEEKLFQREKSFEQINVELEASTIAESYLQSVLGEWRDRVGELELLVENSSSLEKSMESVMKELERNGDLLLAAECEINSYKEKVSYLEISLGKNKVDLHKSEENLEKARAEASVAINQIMELTSELKTVEEKIEALENKKLTDSEVQERLEEKLKLINEIGALRVEEEKSKTAMQSLASALHEVSAEARELKERLMSSEFEHKGLGNQIEDLNLMLASTNKNYESFLDNTKFEINHLKGAMDHSKVELEYQLEDIRVVVKEVDEKYVALVSDAKQEMNHLKETVEHLNSDVRNANTEWEKKELQLVDLLKTAESEKLALSSENEKYESMVSDANHKIDHLRSVIEESKMEKKKTSKSERPLASMLDDAKDEIKHLSNMIEKSKVVSESRKHEWEKQQVQLVDAVDRLEVEKSSMEKEIIRVLNLLREKEEEIFKLKASCVREALEEENAVIRADLKEREGQLLNVARENEQLQAIADVNARKLKELTKLLEEATCREESMQNGELMLSDSEKEYDILPRVVEFSEENGRRREDKQPERSESYSGDSVPKTKMMMWESCKIDKNDLSAEHENVVDDEVDPKPEAFDQFQSESDQTSPSKEQQHKKKNPLYRKFGSLLKKGIGNHK